MGGEGAGWWLGSTGMVGHHGIGDGTRVSEKSGQMLKRGAWA